MLHDAQRPDPEAMYAAADPVSLRLIPWSAIAIPPGESWRVRDLLPRNVVAAGYGASESGKTFWFIDLGGHIAAGWDWRGSPVEQCGVLYVAAEASASVQKRIVAWRQHHGLDADSDTPFHMARGNITLANDDDVEALVADWREANRHGLRVELIVIDTLACVFVGDENSTEDMSGFVRRVKEVHERTGADIILVHHTGKEMAKGMRGSSVLRAAVDIEIEIDGSNPKRRSATLTKSRDMEKGAEFPFDLVPVEIGTDDDGYPIKAAVVRALAAEEDPPSFRRLTERESLAMRILTNHMIDEGVQNITVEQHTALMTAHGVVDGDHRQISNKANKLRTALYAKNAIMVHNGRVFLPRRPQSEAAGDVAIDGVATPVAEGDMATHGDIA